MSVVASKSADHARDVVAGRILALLTEQTACAQALAAVGDGTSLNDLLETRRAMLEELERTVHALDVEQRTKSSTRPPIIGHWESLLTVAKDLERANSRLLATAKAECMSIAEAIKELDRPDGVASAYASTEGETTRRLDLIR